jgi:hypothetical protein
LRCEDDTARVVSTSVKPRGSTSRTTVLVNRLSPVLVTSMR